MDANSSKPANNRNSQVFALEIIRGWLRENGGRQRIPTALEALVEATITAVSRNEPPPEKDGASLVDTWRLAQKDDDAPATTPRGPEFEKWWSTREGHIRQVLLDQGGNWLPRLEVRRGGGRGLPTMYVMDLAPLEPGSADEEPADTTGGSVPDGGLRYRIDPAKPALWLRLLVGSRPFPVNSWRGYVLLGSAALIFALIGLACWGVITIWLQGRPITTADLALGALAALVSMALWQFSRPIRLLPIQRVTLAHAGFLAWNVLHGQLRTMRQGESRLPSRVFSVVRHWGTCPVCAAEVDLADGGAEFPGRLVSRCSDSPLEHVFSFDPVRLVGRPLRTHL